MLFTVTKKSEREATASPTAFESKAEALKEEIRESSFSCNLQTQREDVISDAELKLLQNRVGGLKLLATAVGEELVQQDEIINDLIASTDHADAKVKEAI